MHALDDTIAAIATPIGQGGIGIVRLSGPQAVGIALTLFRAAHRRLRGLQPFRLHHGWIIDPATNKHLDEVLLAYMRAPRSYTRQDVIEINAHGGPVALRAILAECLAAGARAAGPGEFTLRAFVNGRIDLAQAEAVLDVIRSQTDAALRVALDQLGGRLSAAVRAVRQRLLHALAYLAATGDFPEEDLPPQEIAPALESAQSELVALLRQAEQGLVYREGVRVAIVGRPNVGKSSLLNALLHADRAIVTPIPGTTRDTLEETLNLQGVPVLLNDTAGLAERTDDVIERLGIARSQQAIARADLALLVVDGSEPLTPADFAAAGALAGRPALLVVNKGDLPPCAQVDDLLPDAPCVVVSARTGQGLPQLEAALLDAILGGRIASGETPAASNPRHRDALQRALAHLQAALAAHLAGLGGDLAAIDLADAVDALGEITGETASEGLLDAIFGQFCLGK